MSRSGSGRHTVVPPAGCMYLQGKLDGELSDIDR